MKILLKIKFNPQTSGTDDPRVRVQLIRELNEASATSVWDRVVKDAERRSKKLARAKFSIDLVMSLTLLVFAVITLIRIFF